MNRTETLIHAFEYTANSHPDNALVFAVSRTNTQRVSYSDLASKSSCYSRALQRVGIQRGDCVGLLFSTRPEFIISFMGILRSGGVAVPLPTFSGLQSVNGFVSRLSHIIQHSGIRYILAEQKFLDLLRQSLGEDFLSRHRVLTLEDLERETLSAPDVMLHDTDLCLVQYTSGSTSAPKGVALTHRNVLAGLAAIIKGMQATTDDITCSWMPLFHDMGLIGLLTSIYCGSTHYLHSQRSFVGNPGAWLRQFAECGATVYKGPNFSYRHMTENIADEQLTGLDLSKWRVAFNGSEPIDPVVIERFIERFSAYGFRPETMMPVYGMAEATLAVSFSPLGTPPKIAWFDRQILADEGKAIRVSRSAPAARGLVAVGKAVLDHTLRIVDENGNPLPEHRVGEIQVKGPAVMSGYYGDREATSETIQQGWLRTGDLGFISDGLVFITGRIKELVIVNGRKFYPQDVERLVCNVQGVYQGHCIAFGQSNNYWEQMSLVVETSLTNEGDRDELKKTILSILSEQLGLSSVDILLVKRGGIPRTTSGKYQRVSFRDSLKTGEYIAEAARSTMA